MSLEIIGSLSVAVQMKIDARNKAKVNRKKLLLAYTEETGEFYDYFYRDNENKEPLIDDAHIACKTATKELSTARTKLRREIRKFIALSNDNAALKEPNASSSTDCN